MPRKYTIGNKVYTVGGGQARVLDKIDDERLVEATVMRQAIKIEDAVTGEVEKEDKPPAGPVVRGMVSTKDTD